MDNDFSRYEFEHKVFFLIFRYTTHLFIGKTKIIGTNRSKQQLSSKNSTGNSNFSSANNGDATKRFANAKSISSAQYFNNNSADVSTLALLV